MPPLSPEDQAAMDDIAAAVFETYEAAPPPKKPRPKAPPSPAPLLPPTDVGNALRFQAEYGDDVLYCPPLDAWYLWTGTHWQRDLTLQVPGRVRDLAYALMHQAADAHDAALAKHALSFQSASRLAACLTVARSLPGLAVLPEALDAPDFLLATPGGTLDLATGRLVPATRPDRLTQLCPTSPAAEPVAPLWEAFLAQIVPDPAVRWFLQKAVGYSLTADTREQCLFMLHGTGANGKSTFLDTLLAVIGPVARHVPSDLFRGTTGTPHPSNRAFLRGLRLAIVSETEHGQALTESLVKQLTGDTAIDAREMYGDWFTFRPTAKLWWGCNHLPHIKGTDTGFWRRVHRVPFTVTIPEADQDRTLGPRLLTEAPQILAWAVAGCQAWLAEGLRPPPAVRAATAEYRTNEDFVAQFLDECCQLDPAARTRSADLFARATTFATEDGLRKPPLGRRAFLYRLTERGFDLHRSNGSTYVSGIRVLVPEVSYDN